MKQKLTFSIRNSTPYPQYYYHMLNKIILPGSKNVAAGISQGFILGLVLYVSPCY